MCKNLQVLLSAAIIFFCNSLAADVPLAERDALIALYNSTNGANWTSKTNWTVDDPCTNIWFGVSCSGGDTSVSWLDLNGNNLQGSIPADVGDLSGLAGMNLSGNVLSGSMPAELGDLSSLEILYLQSNQLDGSIPSQFSNLSNLVEMDLSRNLLAGTIPAGLGTISGLEYLYLNNNQISGSQTFGFCT